MSKKKWIYLMIGILLFFIGRLLMGEDYPAFLQWWAAAAILGIIFLPLATLLFRGFYDRGYLFSKAIGVAVTGYLMWMFSSLRLMKFTPLSCVICVVAGLLLNGAILLWRRIAGGEERLQKPSSGKSVLDAALGQELMFFGLFLLFTYIRCFKPEAYGTEKFMDYGFMTSMMRSDYMPPQDFWFSGTKLNYYYVGQYIAVYLAKLSRVKIADAYNLMLMMVGAFTAVLPYSLVYNAVLHYMERKERDDKEATRKYRFLPALSGILAGAGVCIAGNMHYPAYRWFEPAVRKFFGMEAGEGSYWFPDATRFIGYHPETSDKTIHEFPAYSFVLGDLHAHVVNILFVLTVLGLLYSWLIQREELGEARPPVWKEVLHPAILMLSFFIGLFHTTNFWDFPIYYVVAGGVILFSNLVVYNFKGKALWLTGLQGVFVFALSYLVCLPFTVNFDQISTNLCLTVARTPLNQLVILWGLPVFVVISFIGALISNHKKDRKEEREGEEKGQPVIFHFLSSLKSTDLFYLVLGLCAIGLVILPEVVYVEDIYSGDFKRANTMFKLTYQAFIMFGLCFGYILPKLLVYGRTARQRRYAVTGLVLLLLTVAYIQNAVKGWYGNIFDRSRYEGLDATAFMDTKMPEDALAIDWLNENITGTPVVLEANGDSYTDYQRVSVMTGLPTVLGWRTHEWLWKGNPEVLDVRAADIETIYTSAEEETIRSLIRQYDIAYIYVGRLEQEKYETVNHELLKSLGTVVYEAPGEAAYETYIVRVGE